MCHDYDQEAAQVRVQATAIDFAERIDRHRHRRHAATPRHAVPPSLPLSSLARKKIRLVCDVKRRRACMPTGDVIMSCPVCQLHVGRQETSRADERWTAGMIGR